jgi:hypothetical protein
VRNPFSGMRRSRRLMAAVALILLGAGAWTYLA